MSTNDLIDAVLEKVPDADISIVLDLITSCDADLNRVFTLLGVQSASKKRQMTFDDLTSRKPSKVTKTSADLVNLYTRSQVENANIFCTLHRNVLDSSVANRLAVTLNEESSLWQHRSFYLFERKVTSGHASALYTDKACILNGEEIASYQGTTLPTDEIFQFPHEMTIARDAIERIVQKHTPNWKSSVVVVNKYTNRFEKLDYHSDQLTHLGTKPTIAALSLGCTREFRLKDRSTPPQRPVYSIRVPHNSLIIMHGECQERFKHCIPVANSIDPDPLLGTTRISLTFRMYKPELNEKTIPKCSCDTPMVLRNTLPDKNGQYRYLWQCAQHYSDGKGCNKSRLYTESR